MSFLRYGKKGERYWELYLYNLLKATFESELYFIKARNVTENKPLSSTKVAMIYALRNPKKTYQQISEQLDVSISSAQKCLTVFVYC